ncbi:MAG: TonB-dependent receptor, partial [Alphaproteobacteria bacterium]|nr:TonB-dependent receptor [Alphaproteobacteria bacterium]
MGIFDRVDLHARLLAGCAALALAAPTFAQATAAADAAADEEIIVTGTLIANPNIESSSPVTVVGEDELVLRNVSNVENLLRQLPGVVAGVGAQTNNGNGGFASIDLRGLGSKRNLVLLDGQRIVPAQQNGTVDLNNIPVAIIARTEVLTGGASTTYGADAVSGVVNFITKKDFEGVDLSSSYQITERGDGPIFRTDLTIGGNFADGRGNAVLSVGYQKAKPVYQGDRDISVFGINSASTGAAAGTASGSSPTSVPVTLGFSNLGLIGVTGTTAQVNPAGTLLVAPYQGFNFNPFNIFQTPYERQNMYGSANYEVSDNLEVYARAIFSRNAVKTIIAPSGIFGEALTVPGNNPYLPATLRDQLCQLNGIALGASCNTAAAIALPVVYRRTVEIGPRISDYRTTMFDTRVGATYTISDSIKANIEASRGESDLVQKQSGYVLRSRVQQALNANNTTTCTVTTNGCVPLNLFGSAGSISPAQAAFLNGASTITIKNTLDQVRGLVSGDTGVKLPAAAEPVSFAVGAEYRKYGYLRDPDAFSISPGELGGAGGAVLPFEGGYTVKEGYAELVAPLASDRPLIQDLSVEAGIRYSSYNVDTRTASQNKATTWKVGVNWEASDAVKFRGNFQRAVRAPNIDELFRPVATAPTSLLIDPCAGTAPVGNANL